MKISQVIDSLQKNTPNHNVIRNINSDIYAFHAIVRHENPETNVIYICTPNTLPIIGSMLPLNFLCQTSSPDEKLDDAYLTLYPNSNFILFSRKCSEKELYDLVGAVFLSELRYAQMITSLLDFSSNNHGLQALVDTANSIIGFPIVILDSSYRILAMSQPNTYDEILGLNEQRNLGYISEKNLKRMKRDRIYDQLRKSPSNYTISKATDATVRWYNTLVYVHGIEVAEIGIPEYGREFNNNDVKFFRHFKQLVEWEMEHENFYLPNKGIMHSIFISELLEQKFTNTTMVEKRKQMLGWNEEPGYFVLTVFAENEVHFRKKAEFFALQVQKLFPYTRWAIEQTHMILLLAVATPRLELFGPSSELAALFRNNHMYGTLSNHFSDLLEMKKNYDQTLAIREFINIRNTETPIIHYSDYSLFHMAKILSDSYDIRDFYSPIIKLIEKYDNDYHTPYLETLKEFLLHADNPTLCSENLCIHKNTFFYRMNKIRELFPVDFNDGLIRMHLLMTLELMKLRTS